MEPKRRQAIIWTNGGIGYRRIYVSLGLNELSYSVEGPFSFCDPTSYSKISLKFRGSECNA